MRAHILVLVAAIVASSYGLAQDSARTPAPPQYRLIVENETIRLTDAQSGRLLAKTTFGRWGVASPTRDKLRHVALDVTAAVVAGNGGREHTVDPNMPVCTASEKAPLGSCITATVEHGIGFIIVSDSESTSHYEALLSGAPVSPR